MQPKRPIHVFPAEIHDARYYFLSTGIEYMSASHMIMRGLVAEGLDIAKATRARYDGSPRNPWNDIECGSYYARSMSAWQLVNAGAGATSRLRQRYIKLQACDALSLPAASAESVLGR